MDVYKRKIWKTVLAIAFFGAVIFSGVYHEEIGFLFRQEKQSPAVIKDPDPEPVGTVFLSRYIRKFNSKLYDRLAQEIVRASIDYGRKYKIPPIHIIALMQIESEFNINAISKKDARGLMQINLSVWTEELAEREILPDPAEIHDPRRNIESGCYILRHYIDQEGSLELALYKYLGAESESYRDNFNRAVGDILMDGFTQNVGAAFDF
jgi:hypothetical protein